MEIIARLYDISKNVKRINLTINWHYEGDDEDMLDSGKEFEKMTGVTMNYIVKN